MATTAYAVWNFLVPEIIFGVEARHLAGRYAKHFGLRRVLVVTDPGVLAAGWPAQVAASLEANDVSYLLFSQVTPNPRAHEVMEGATVYERERCDGIVAVGGGSAIDCAKGVGIAALNHRHVLELEGVDQIDVPGPPLICVPTTFGSSADVSQFAVLTDERRKTKIVIVSKALVPDVSLVDPLTTTTLAPHLAAPTGVDAFIHAVESYVSSARSPITDIHALAAVRVITRALPRILADPGDLPARVDQMLGSLVAGLAFSNAGLGVNHAIAHSVGGHLDLVHGECGAMLLEPVIAFNFEAAEERYRDIGDAMGLDLRDLPRDGQRTALVGEMRRLCGAACAGRTLRDVGLRREIIPEVAERAMEDPFMVTNPRRPCRRDIEVLLEEAL